MAISSYKTFLMKKTGTGTDYEKLVDIKNFPDLGGPPEPLETTTLSDKSQTFIPGIQTFSAFEFTANYTPTDFAKVEALEGKEGEFAVWFGGTENADGTVKPTGDEGKFSFKGKPSSYVNGADVNGVINMTISILPSTVIAPESQA